MVLAEFSAASGACSLDGAGSSRASSPPAYVRSDRQAPVKASCPSYWCAQNVGWLDKDADHHKGNRGGRAATCGRKRVVTNTLQIYHNGAGPLVKTPILTASL